IRSPGSAAGTAPMNTSRHSPTAARPLPAPAGPSHCASKESSMAHAIRFSQTGGPEVLRYESVEVGEPGPGEVRVRHSYIAVNFIDIYFRTGRYPLALPNGIGSNAIGIAEAVGEGVTDVRPGDRVGYLMGPQGAYCDVRVMPADVLIPLPEGVDDRT